VERQLKSLPDGIEKTYEKIISNIPTKDRENALKIMQWLSFSARPLWLDELAQVVGAVPNQESVCFQRSCVYRKPELVLRICSSLITKTESNSPTIVGIIL
jgi:hypothetical protein